VSALRRAALASASAGLALAAGWYLLARRPDPTETTVIVDDTAEVERFLSERASNAEVTGQGPLTGEISEEDAWTVFGGIKSTEMRYDPETYYQHVADLRARRPFPEHPHGGWMMRTNAQGFREDEDLPAHPDVRIFVAGDSHTDGVCDNHLSFANDLERLLAAAHPGKVVDVINGGVGSWSFYNYLGALEKNARELDLDVFVCAVYGGNDFLGTLRPRHYFARTKIRGGGQHLHERVDAFRRAAGETADRNLGQAIFQLSFLTEYPDEAELAVSTANDLTRLMAQRAEELGVKLVFAYIPALWDVQLARYEEKSDLLLRALRLHQDGAIRTADPWADRWLATLQELGLPCADLRAAWRATDVELYWHRDYHINVEGHKRVAEALAPLVEPLLGLD